MTDEKQTAKRNPAELVKVGSRGIIIETYDELLRFANKAVEAGTVPRGMNPAAAAMAIQAGMERGLGPLGGLQQVTVINGNLSWKGQGAFALIQNSGVCKAGTLQFWTEGTGDDKKGVAVAHRIGYAVASRSEFSVKDAKQAGLWGKSGPWTQYPDRQLKWRALGFLARDTFPDVLGGFPLDIEAADYEDTPAPEPIGKPAEIPPPSSPDPLMAAMSIAAEELAADIETVISPERTSGEPGIAAAVGRGHGHPDRYSNYATEPAPPTEAEAQANGDAGDKLACDHGVSLLEWCGDCHKESEGGG